MDNGEWVMVKKVSKIASHHCPFTIRHSFLVFRLLAGAVTVAVEVE